MKYLSRVMNLDWLGKNDKSQTVETPPEDPRNNKGNENHDVSVSHFKDEGGIYLVAFDWDIRDVKKFVHNGFAGEWEREMENTGLCVISGRIGKDEEIEIVHTSLDEIFEHENDG